MSAKQNADVLLEIFAAVERRDAQRVSELCEADVEFSQPALGHTRGGILDCWGCPADRAEAVISEVRTLIDRGSKR